MALEIERKFLVDKDKWATIDKPEGILYRQGYILLDIHRTVRVRITPMHGYLTIKGISKGAVRNEFEYEIPREDALQLLDLFCTNEISKKRYCISLEGKLWEVDVFEGRNKGLIVAEIELNEEHESFVKPEWILDEVTEDTRYYNSNLSIHPFAEW